MKRLCPLDSQQCPALPYSNEVFTSTPKRKSKTESKKHARWKLWFLWIKHKGFGNCLFFIGHINTPCYSQKWMKEYSEGVINPWQWITTDRFIWVETASQVSWGTAKTKNILNSVKKPFTGMCAGEVNTHLQKLGELWDTFCTCILFGWTHHGPSATSLIVNVWVTEWVTPLVGWVLDVAILM